MRVKLAYIRERLSPSIWFIPIGRCRMGAVLGLRMLSLGRHLGPAGTALAPLAISLDSARQVLGGIAGSIIDAGGVAFSITMVALTLTSGQFGPKLLRSLLEDGVSKVTLGLFLSAYVSTLIVLSGYAQTDRPQRMVDVALVLALSALVAFVGFIHRTATDLQADNIIHQIGGQLQRTLHDLVTDVALPGRLLATGRWRCAATALCQLPQPPRGTSKPSTTQVWLLGV